MWSTQKNLSNLITGVVIHKKFDLFPVLEDELNNNFKNFLDVLKDPPASAVEREKVKKSVDEPIAINYLKVQKKLPSSLIEEALALSDLFGMSEYAAVELLIEAEEQMQFFHGFNRGLTAILLYYDSKNLLVNNLKTLILARPGRTWILNEDMPNEISNFISDYINKLIQNGLITKLINQISLHDWTKTEENLLRVNGLGSLKHRKQVKNLFEEIKISLAECIYDCACQAPLNQKDTITVINFLKNNCQIITNQSLNTKSTIENSHLYLIMALLYCFDTTYLENKEHAEVEKIFNSYLKDDYIKNIYNELNKSDNAEWLTIGIKSVLQFAFQLFICILNNYMIENENQTFSQLLSSSLSGLEDDEVLIEKAIEQHVFSFIKNTIIQHEKFHNEKYFVERVHNLVTEFIYKMPEKIKDMRNRNEDIFRLVEDSYSQAANPNYSYYHHSGYGSQSLYNRPQSSQPENHDCEDLLNLIGDLYVKDPLKLELSLNFWIADSEINPNIPSNYQKPTQKQISLYKFVRYFLSGENLIGCLYIAYVNMLTGLCTGEESAQHCFLLLQSNAHFYDSHGPKISWSHILYAFEKYYDSFKMDQNMVNMPQQANNFGYQNPNNPINTQLRGHVKGITQQELQGLISVTKLVKQIAFYNEKVRVALCEYQRGETSLMNSFNNSIGLPLSENNLPTVMFGLLTCSIPISLKGEILNLLSSFSLTPLIAVNMWQLLESSQILPTITSQQTGFTYLRNDIKVELEEVESREETYPLLKGFLNLIRNLVTNTNVPENLGIGLRPKNSILGFQPYLHFLVNHVYLKVLYRSYKNIQEKWQLASDILEIFYQIILKYEINTEDFQISQNQDPFQISAFKSPISNSPGYRLIYDFIHDGPIVRMLFLIMNESLNHLLEYNIKNDKFIELTSLTTLKIVSLIIEKQKLFIDKMKMANLSIESTGIEKLIIALNPTSNKAEYFMSILRFIQFNSSLINHSYYALNIINMLSSYSIINSQLLNLFLKSCLSLNEQFELMHSFVEFLEYDESNELSKEDNLLLSLKTNLESIDINDSNTSTLTGVGEQTGSGNSSYGDEMRCASRLKALKLLLYYLRLPAPNIAHLLLGFDINKPLKNQQFFNPGTKINYTTNKGLSGLTKDDTEILSIVPRNCLHSIIRILNKFLKEPNLISKMTNTIDSCYEILFILCSNFQYNQQLLNYLRNEFDFINNNLKKIPIQLNDIMELERMNRTGRFKDGLNRTLKETNNILTENNLNQENLNLSLKKFKADLGESNAEQTNYTSLYSLYSWILNLTCIEMQTLIANRMKTHLKKVVQILIDNTNSSSVYFGQSKEQANSSKIFSNTNFDSLIYLNNSSMYQTNRNKSLFGGAENLENKPNLDVLNQNSNSDISENNKLFSLLSFVNFSQISPEQLNLSYFDQQLIEKVIESCKYVPDFVTSTSNIQLYDLKRLKTILFYEIKESGINIPRSNLLNELKYILQNVYERNQFQLSFIYKKKYFESLKLLIEAFVLLTPCDVFNLNQRYSLLVSLIKRIFQTINSENLVVELTYSVSNILFTLVSNLRQVISQIRKHHSSGDTNMSVLTQQQAGNFLNLSNLTEIFKKIIDYLLNSSLTNFKVRTHLYATILNYLMIFDLENDSDSQEKVSLNELSSKNIEYFENLKILLNNMNSLLKIICTDSCEGLNITTMMGLSLMNKIIDLDSNNTKWIKYISDNGYITCIINTINNTDNQLLEECFHSQMKNDKVIYIFETKIALFLSISKSSFGSELLIKHGLINSLVSCSIFNLRIKFDRNIYGHRNSGFLVQLLHQYYQLLFPILNLCISIINTMGSNNIESKSQIARFVLSHSEIFLHILTSKISDIKMLEELKLVTALIAKLAPFDNLKFENLASNFSVEYNSIFSRIHKEILNLISVYFVPDQLKQLRRDIEHNSANKENINKISGSYLADIASNICSYCTSIMKVGQFNIPFLIFTPKIESHDLHPYSPTLMRLNSKHLQLGLLINFLKFSMENLEKTIDLESDLNTKNDHINDLIEIEKKQLVGEYKLYEKMSENEKQLFLKQQLKLHLKSTKHDFKNYISIIEKSMLILWRHIEFYLTNFDSNIQSYQLFKNDLYSLESLNELENLRKTSDKHKNDVSKEDFIKFRQDLMTSLSPNFFKRCSDIEQKIGSTRRDNFIGILVKRIQRLIHLQGSN